MDNAKIYHYLIRFQDYKLLLLTILHRMFKQYVKMLKLNSFICCHIPQTLTLSKKHLYNQKLSLKRIINQWKIWFLMSFLAWELILSKMKQKITLFEVMQKSVFMMEIMQITSMIRMSQSMSILICLGLSYFISSQIRL